MPKRSPRLQFTAEEAAAPELEKAVSKAGKAADRLEKAEGKIPQKKIKRRAVDPDTGKVTARLSFEEKKPPSKLSHVVKDAPLDALLIGSHRKVRENADGNVGVESADAVAESAEMSARAARGLYREHQQRPFRTARKAEARADKANLKALMQESNMQNPGLSSNPYSRWQQKRAIKKEYAAAKAAGGTAGNTMKASEVTAKAAKKSVEKTKKTTEFFRKHKKGLAIAGILVLMVAFLSNALSSCSIFVQGGISSIAISTYPSADSDMLAAEAQYLAMEQELQSELDNYETTRDYDEYHYELDEIEHDPYVLISALTALKGGAWTIDEVQDTLQMLFEKQYILTETVTTETRYREETRTGTSIVTDPETGESYEEEYEYTVQVPYTYYICNVKLENFNLSHVPVYVMSSGQLSMYATYMGTLGNRPDLFAGSAYVNKYYRDDYEKYEIPPEALEDEQFAAMITEAEKYLGYPYVWGGSSPSTSFDCSGFVSWVINHCGVGWNVGRLGAEGLRGICTRVSPSEAKPGDLIFFERTYNTSGASHVGIYVGNNMMLHCGDPIHYTNINTSYWQDHFLAFGRLPRP